MLDLCLPNLPCTSVRSLPKAFRKKNKKEKTTKSNPIIQQSCSKERGLPHTEASLHLQACRPTCPKCYRTHVCRRARYRHSEPCKLERSGEEEADVWRYGSSIRRVCGSCVGLSPRVQQARREARDRIELDRLARLPLACSRCKMSLPDRGPRWWVCSTCSSECQHRVHPGWTEKMDV